MTGRMVIAEAAPGAKMSKAKIVKIMLVSLLATLLLAAAARSMPRYDGAQLSAFFGSDYFLMFCVGTHTTSICIMAWLAAMARTPALRRHYADSAVASAVHLAVNLYFVVSAKCQEGPGCGLGSFGD